MKSLFTKSSISVLAIVLLILSGCAHKDGLTKCPDMGTKHARPVFAKQHYAKAKRDKVHVSKDNVREQPKRANQVVSFIAGKTPLNVTIPSSYIERFEEGEFERVNAVFASNSNNRVSLKKNASGKVVLHADSRRDLRKAVTQIAFKRPATGISGETGDILALVGGILGIVSAATSPIPFVNFLSIFLGAGAIVLGILGWRSERRRIWSRLGVILGAIGISLAILFIILYFVVFNLFYF